MDQFAKRFKVVVAGGAGAMGRITVRDLVQFFPEAEVVIADFDQAKAAALAKQLKTPKPAFIDVTRPETLEGVLLGAFAVINCCPYQFNLDVMNAALKVGCHYLDLGGLFHMTRRQLKLHLRFKQANLLAVLGMGASPGLTNLLAAHGAAQLDEVTEIHVRLGARDLSKYESIPALPVAYSLKTILEEFSKPPALFTKGKLTFVEPMSGEAPFRFPSPVGVVRPFYTLHSELATLPVYFRDKGVKEVSFKIAFDEDFVGKVKFLRDLGLAEMKPVNVQGTEISPLLVVDKVAMSQKPAKRVGALKQYEILRVIVKGKRKTTKRTIVLDCHTTGMPKWNIGTDVNTGCPPAIAVKLLALEPPAVRGALPPENIFSPEAFFKNLRPRGMTVTVNDRSGWGEKI